MYIYLIIFILSLKIFNYFLYNGLKIKFRSKYYFRYYNGKYLTKNSKVIDEIKTIAIESINLIPRYPVFEGKELYNKHIIIIYNNKDNPVAANIFFEWYYKKIKIYHMGLFLVSKNYQKNGLQYNLGCIQSYLNVYLNNFKEFYISDIGNSPSGFKAIDKYVCYELNPSLKKKTSIEFKKLSKKIAKEFYDKHAIKSAGCSKLSKYDYDNMIIINANLKNGGGFHELVEFVSNRQSRNNEYNNFVNNLLTSKFDEFVIIGKVSILYLLFY